MSKSVEIRYDRSRDEFEVALLVSKAQSVIVFRLSNEEAIGFIQELQREVQVKIKAAPKRLRLIPGGAD